MDGGSNSTSDAQAVPGLALAFFEIEPIYNKSQIDRLDFVSAGA